jgi:hypothetical protein
MAKKAKVYTGTEWVDLASSTADLSQYYNLTTNQPTFRNVFINGGFSVDQRNAGASQTITAGAALAYTVDRWYAYCTGANITGARVAGAAPSQFFYRFTGATSNTAVGFGQRIEAANCFHLANQNVTLGINIASTSLTSITWTAFYANTTDTFGTLASPTRTQIATGTFTVSSTLSRKTATFTVPSAATTGIEIVFTGGALLGSQTLTYDDAQLEVGSVASAFEYRPIGTELALCQRYFQRYVDPPLRGVASVSTQVARTGMVLPVPLRATPSSSNIFAGTLMFYDGTAGVSYSSIASSYLKNTHVEFDISTTAGLTVGRAVSLYQGGGGTMSLDAEL